MQIEVISKQKPLAIEGKHINVSLYGSLIGLIKEENLHYSSQAIELISEISSFEDFENFLYQSIGSYFCVVTIDHESRCYSSLVHNGFYFVHEPESETIKVSEEESDLINEFTLVKENSIKRVGIANPGLMRFPFFSMFENISRCPAGTFISENEILINDYLRNVFDHTISLDNQLSVDLFEKRLSLILKAYSAYYGELSLFMSGGIDSSLILSILNKYKISTNNYFIPYSGINSNNRKIAEYVTNYLNSELQLVEKDKLSETDFIDLLLNRSRSGPGAMLGFMYKDYYQRRNIENRTVITGQNLDSMYHVDTFAPNTEYTGLYRALVILKSSLLRIRYTSLNVFLTNLKTLLFSNSDIRIKQFIDTLISDEEHFKSSSDTPDIGYQKLKEKEAERLSNFLNINKEAKLTSYTQNLYFKAIKFFRFVQNTYSNYYVLSKAEDLRRINPYGEGPILELLITYKLPIFSIFKIKHISHSLFKRLVGVHHNVLVRRSLNYSFLVDLNLVLKYFLGKLFRKKNTKEENHINYVRKSYEVLRPYINMKFIKLHPTDQKYIDKLLRLIQKESHINEKKCDEILRVLGTLVYLSQGYENKNQFK